MAPSSNTVVVACKHPPGIFMTVYEMGDHRVAALGGGMHVEPRSVAKNKPFKINGPATPFGQAPKGLVVGGYALTSNVPEDLAKAWMEQNKESDLVRNNLIYIADKADNAAAKAKEQKAVKSGLEPLDVATIAKNGQQVHRDPRWPARNNPNVTGISTDAREDA